MRTMMLSDYLNVRGALVQLAGTSVVIAAFVAVGAGSIAAVAAALAAMLPFMLMFTLAALDERDGWERFRLTLPVTRRQVVCGRYAFVGLATVASALFALALSCALVPLVPLLPFGDRVDDASAASLPVVAGSAVGAASIVIVAMAVAQPLMMRFGMTKATRIVPMAMVLAVTGVAVLAGSGMAGTDLLQQAVRWLDTGSNYLALIVGVVAFDVLAYALSALVAVKLYERRTF